MPGSFRVCDYYRNMDDDSDGVWVTVTELEEMNRRLRRLERLILGHYIGRNSRKATKR